MQTAKKKKIIVIAAAAVLAVIMMTFGTVLAWLTKPIEYRANNFTFGSIDIDLEEEEWEDEDHTVYPGRVVAKDPVVVNQGKNALYAYLEVWVPFREVKYVDSQTGSDVVMGPEAMELLKWEASTLDTDWRQFGDVAEVADEAGLAYHVYRFAYTKLVPPESSGEPNKTSKLFQTVTFWDTIVEEEPEGVETFEMPVKAYAIQAEYVDAVEGNNLYDKMVKAFEKYLSESGS